jgi:hypothetical protein
MKKRRPISEKKLRANRENAKKSTGPKTWAGKLAVRRNALKHGLRSNTLNLQPDECEVFFNDLLLSIKTTGEPKTIQEEWLLEEIAGLWWKLRRVIQQQGDSVSHISDPGSDHSTALRLLRRYEGSISRQLSVRIRRVLQERESAEDPRGSNLCVKVR